MGEYLVVDIENKHWFCNKNGQEPVDPNPLEADSVFDLSEFGIDTNAFESRALTRCPVGGYNVCPNQSGTPAPVPNPDDVTSNPLGTCRCNGELWVSEGCSYGFYCDDTQEKGGYLKVCNEVGFNLAQYAYLKC